MVCSCLLVQPSELTCLCVHLQLHCPAAVFQQLVATCCHASHAESACNVWQRCVRVHELVTGNKLRGSFMPCVERADDVGERACVKVVELAWRVLTHPVGACASVFLDRPASSL